MKRNIPVIHYACIKTAVKKVFIIIGLLFAFMAVVDFLKGEPIKYEAFLYMGTGSIPIVFLVFYLLSKFFPVKLYETKIRCANPNGKTLKMQYSNAKAVELMSIYGFHYLYVSDEQDNKIAIPLFLPDLNMFCRDIEFFAGENNVIVKAIKEYIKNKIC